MDWNFTLNNGSTLKTKTNNHIKADVPNGANEIQTRDPLFSFDMWTHERDSVNIAKAKIRKAS